MTEPRLTRALWQYEYGKLAPELLEIELRAVLDDIGDRSVDVLAQAQTIRLWAPDLLQSRADAFAAAIRAVDIGTHRDAVKEISRCDHVLHAMRELLRAVTDSDRAESAMTVVYELAVLPRLRALPAVASLAQVVDLARQHIIERQFARASRIAGVCARIAESVLERQLDDSIPAHLDERIRELEHLCRSTRQFTFPPHDDPGGDGTFVVLRRLLTDGYRRLVSRLLTELEIQLAGCRRFLLLYEGSIDAAMAFGSLDQVRSVIGDLSWDGAVDHYWHLSIASHAREVVSLVERISVVAASIEAAIREEPLAAD